jgi:hypothetical protein
MISIRQLGQDGELHEVTIAPVGYQASEDELAGMYAALFGAEPVTCPRPADHKLHTVSLNEYCPHCGGTEPAPAS